AREHRLAHRVAPLNRACAMPVVRVVGEPAPVGLHLEAQPATALRALRAYAKRALIRCLPGTKAVARTVDAARSLRTHHRQRLAVRGADEPPAWGDRRHRAVA